MQLKDDKQIGSFSGGLAEIVSAPSDVTMSYLEKWFKGTSALGKAYEILGMLCDQVNESILERRNGELLVNLDIEQRTLYNATLLKYQPLKNIYETPVLAFDPKSVFNPIKVRNTLKILFVQAKWISASRDIVENLDKIYKGLGTPSNTMTLQQVEETMAREIMPSIIAIGAVTEFFYHLIESNHKDTMSDVKKYIDSKLAENDWYFKSVRDQLLVHNGGLGFADYIKTYGLRADNDYELECPRWYEIPHVIKERILQMEAPKSSNQHKDAEFDNEALGKDKHIKAYIDLCVLRSNAKRLSLSWIDALRQQLLASNKLSVKSYTPSNGAAISQNIDSKMAGLGLPISSGNVEGMIQIIKSSKDLVPNGTIGVFPNSGTDFTHLFTKCIGIIFLRGGQTSHGAIVAREFGIPAITDPTAIGLQDGFNVKIDGGSGSWFCEVAHSTKN